MKSKNWTLIPLFVLCVHLQAQLAQAAVSLADLIATNGSLMVGGSLLFDQFSYSKTGLAPSASSVNVVTLADAGASRYGLRFVGGFQDAPGDGYSSFIVGYRVTAQGNTQVIPAAHLAGNPSLFGNDASGWISISKSFAGMPEKVLNIYDISPDKTKLVDSAELPLQLPSLNVQVDGVLNANSGGASLSLVDSTFQTTTAAVPEPSSVLVWALTMLVGGALVVSHRRDAAWSRLLTNLGQRFRG
jgi:hypothetical protein